MSRRLVNFFATIVDLPAVLWIFYENTSKISPNWEVGRTPVFPLTPTSGKTQSLPLDVPQNNNYWVFLFDGGWLVNDGYIMLPFKPKCACFSPLEKVPFVLDEQRSKSRRWGILFDTHKGNLAALFRIGLHQIAPQGSRLLFESLFTFVRVQKDASSTTFRWLFVKLFV